MGWLRAPTGVVRRQAATKAAADLGSSVPGQTVAAHLLRTEHAQLRRWRSQQLAAALDALSDALARWLSDWQWQRLCGEQTLWVRRSRRRRPWLCPDRPAPRRRRHPREPLLSPDPRGGPHLSIPFVAPADQLIQAVQRLAGAWIAHL
jgi:DNA-binding transcriptional MocR family regulator